MRATGVVTLSNDIEQMSKLVRLPTPRPVGPRTRVLIVRQPMKTVGASHEGGAFPVKLALGVVITIAILAGVWLLGALGHRLGFATAIRVPELAIDPASALAHGALMLMYAPVMIIHAGLSHLGALMLAFFAVIIPAAGLAAARPSVPGGPRQSQFNITFSTIGAVTAGISALCVVWWSASPMRRGLISDLPIRLGDAALWIENLRAAAGLDTMAVLASALWVVLIFRVTLPMWLKALTVTASLAAAVIAMACFSATAGGAAGLQSNRSLCLFSDKADTWHLLLGSTRRQLATLRVDDTSVLIELRDEPSSLDVVGSASVVEFLEQAKVETRPN